MFVDTESSYSWLLEIAKLCGSFYYCWRPCRFGFCGPNGAWAIGVEKECHIRSRICLPATFGRHWTSPSTLDAWLQNGTSKLNTLIYILLPRASQLLCVHFTENLMMRHISDTTNYPVRPWWFAPKSSSKMCWSRNSTNLLSMIRIWRNISIRC